MTQRFWESLFDSDGRILDEYMLRKNTFTAGISPAVRPEAWKFFLEQYPFSSTLSERIDTIWSAGKHYDELLDRADEAERNAVPKFMKVVKIVDKDVARTDRDQPFFAGDDNPNLQSLRNILLAYAAYDPEVGYIQGMNDLLAPILYVMRNELAAYSCFEAYMKRMRNNFIEISMHEPLSMLKKLVNYLDPPLHDHLCSCSMEPGMDWLFCHRWLLLDFKREFALEEIAILWERIWAQHSTHSFQILIAWAILEANKDRIRAIQNPDELLGFLQHLTKGQDFNNILDLAIAGVAKLRSDRRLPVDLKSLVVPTGGATFAPPPRAAVPGPSSSPGTAAHSPMATPTGGGGGRSNRRKGPRYVVAT